MMNEIKALQQRYLRYVSHMLKQILSYALWCEASGVQESAESISDWQEYSEAKRRTIFTFADWVSHTA